MIEAVKYLVVEHASATGPEIELSHDVEFDRLPSLLESAMFRIVQESLLNACRHSRSPRIRVEIFQQENWVRLSVRDWGIGFDPQSPCQGQLGLQRIREQTRLLNGRMSIETAPNQGTHILVELPLEEEFQAYREDSD